MATLGQQILERVEAVENALTDLQLNQQRPIPPGGDGSSRGELDRIRQQFREELANLREQMQQGRIPTESRPRHLMYNQKDVMPEILGHDYKAKWRTWSYKARDWLSQVDSTLLTNLERIEPMTK